MISKNVILWAIYPIESVPKVLFFWGGGAGKGGGVAIGQYFQHSVL